MLFSDCISAFLISTESSDVYQNIWPCFCYPVKFFPCSEWYRVTCNGVREKWHRPSRRPQLVPTGAENHLSSDSSVECWGDMFAWAAAWTQCEGLHKRRRWIFIWICLQGCCKQTLSTWVYITKRLNIMNIKKNYNV